MTESAIDTPKWIKKLQANSWEAEIFISGGAIFSLIQLVDLISTFSGHLKEIRHIVGHNEILIFLHLGINGIIIGFFAHLILRSFWIALVCLQNAFPSGINFNVLRIQGSYLNEARNFNLPDQITRVNNLSGLLFFGSVTFAVIILGVIFYTLGYLVLNGIAEIFMRASLNDITWGPYFIVLLIFYFDFFSGGILRRQKTIGKIYRPLYLFVNFFTLAFIYRSWIQVLFTNVRKWKFAVGAIVFVVASLSLTMMTASRPLKWLNPMDSRNHLPESRKWKLWYGGYYENRFSAGLQVAYACIQSDVVSDGYLRVFVPYKATHDEYMDRAMANQFQNIITLKIDDVTVANPEWFWGEHVFSGQFGITTYIPIDQLAKQKHVLTVDMKGAPWPFPLSIPFWKQ